MSNLTQITDKLFGTSHIDGEIWKEVNFNPNYLVSDKGRIYSLYTRAIINNIVNSYGYCVVTLYNNKKPKVKTVHRLVMESFVPNHKNKPQINHINGIKTDNKVENLEWATAKENIHHSIKTGLGDFKGEKCNMAKLDEMKVFEIYNLALEGYTSSQIAEKYNIHVSSVSLITSGKNWKHLNLKPIVRCPGNRKKNEI